ncbi:MAG: zf-HC2 domain-containing protein [Armatimonadota bacterium]|jgi:hypothetical protein
MNCRQAKELMGAYLYGDLDPDQMRDLRLHAKDCACCREDLLSRGKVISALNDSVPAISDTDRQRIAWSVKGAVRNQQAYKTPLIVRLAPTAALVAVVLLTGFFAGKITNRPSNQAKAIDKKPTRAAVTVEVKEMQAPKGKAVEPAAQLIEVLKAINLPAAMTGGSRETTPGRGQSEQRHYKPAPTSDAAVVDAPAKTKPSADRKESSESMQNSEAKVEAENTKLPKVTDPRSAETTPSADQ